MKQRLTAEDCVLLNELLWRAHQHVQQLQQIESIMRLTLGIRAADDDGLVCDAVMGGWLLEQLAAEAKITLPPPTEH